MDRATEKLEGERQLGTFEGVFTPTLLTILGVMLYLRTGWVVGEVGLLGAWLIIGGAAIITTATALSLSSVATNVKLGAGGPYGIIARSLGLEVGGSIGIPLYFSQAVAVTMYIFGLREGWQWIFPHHPAVLIDAAVFALVVGLASISARVAFRAQYLIMAIIAASLVSVFATSWGRQPEVTWWRADVEFSSPHFWMVFAVFFPAVTGITAGANMSGELVRPNRSIPVGTLCAVAISTAVYLGVAFWEAQAVSPGELRENFTAIIDHSLFAPLVVAGLIGATLSSAINSFVGAPRILQALAAHRVIPGHRLLSRRSSRGEPRWAMATTAMIVAAGLLLRDINAIAPLLTMFFLIAYAGLNLVVLLEQRLALVSFRPRLRLPAVVPLIGLVGSVIAIFVVSPVFGLVSVVAVGAIYGVLLRRHLAPPYADVRSGAFRAVAEWAARRSTQLGQTGARSWKVNLLVPVADPDDIVGDFQLIADLTAPHGSVTIIGVTPIGHRSDLAPALATLGRDFMRLGVHATSSVVEAERSDRGIAHAMQSLRTAFLRPNTLLLRAGADNAGQLHALLDESRANEMGAIVVGRHLRAALGRKSSINVWIRAQDPDWDIEEGLARTNINLLILISYILAQRWRARLRLVTVTGDGERDKARAYLEALAELARLPHAELSVLSGSLADSLALCERADVNLLGMPDSDQAAFIERTVEATHATCLFVRDSGQENAFV